MTRKDADFDLASLLHPARAYGRPPQVLCDPDLTLNEKRAILASWASDACAMKGLPTFGQGLAVACSLIKSWTHSES
jgi:hypothetical protein